MTAVESARAALLAAVLADPDDDLVRLVFADWLEEHGEEARAEFIRVQVRLAEIEREIGRQQFFHGLLLERDRLCGREVGLLPGQRKLADAALTAALGGGFAFNLGRGFVHAVTLPAAAWLAHADALTRAHPVREVRLSDFRDVSLAGSGHHFILYHPAGTRRFDTDDKKYPSVVEAIALIWPAISFASHS